MLSDTGYRRTRMLVTKLTRLTIETGSVTGIQFSPSANVRRLTLPAFSCCSSAQLYPFLGVTSSDVIHHTRPAHAQAVC